ncbi:MAG: monovalent cation/H+ antiporter subunit D family protein [Deltaproteobacteria bacterium]|nr:monovalent cation/H+ antiporter subunit D family protein [Deltaproteobacteria bacterium]
MSPELTIGLCLAMPVIGALLVALTGKKPNLREAMTGLASLATIGLVLTLVAPVMQGDQPQWVVVDALLPGVPLAFRVEPLGMLYALVAAGLWPVTSAYAVGYMRGHHETNQTRFFVCFALSIFAALGIAFAANLGTLFLFYEVLTLCTYPLVTHHQSPEARRSGRIYLGILMGTSIGFLLLAIAWTYAKAGTLDFRRGGILAGHIDPAMLPLLLGLFAYGCGKAALMPLHRWLPNAMVAPTPVSALLHAVAVVKAGVFSVLKIVVYVFGLDLLHSTGSSEWLMWVAAFTLLMGSLIAFKQDNLKARLAYSTIAQLAYIVLGAALVTPDGIVGGGLHIATHAVGKITLFFCAGAILVAAHKKNVSELDGLGRTMPLTMGAFFIASLSIIGVPPMGGSWSKWYLALGAADEHAIFVAVLMVSSLLNIGYLIPIPVRAFFFPPKADEHGDDGQGHGHGHGHGGDDAKGGMFAGEAPWLCVVPLCLTAVGCVVLFFMAHWVVRLIAPIVGVAG